MWAIISNAYAAEVCDSRRRSDPRGVVGCVFHRWKATDVVHARTYGCSGVGHIRMESKEGADQERLCLCRTGSHKVFHTVHDANGENW